MVVIDRVSKKLEAMFDTGIVPHPDRGRTWSMAGLAPLRIGEGKVTVYAQSS